MNKVFFCLIALLTGCTVAPRQPIDVTLIPDDCANRLVIIRWLEDSLKTPPAMLQNKDDYDQDVSAVKNRIWRLRYVCQRV